MSNFKYIKLKGLSLIILASCLVTFQQQANGQSIGTCGYASGTLNLPAAPQNLELTKTYKKTSELFYTLPDSQSIADYNSFDIMHMEPVKRIERLVYTKDASGQDVILKHVLDPTVQFKPSIEPYELMVLYPTSVEIFNRNGNMIFSTDLDSNSVVESGGSGGEGGSGGGSGLDFDTTLISIQQIEGDSIYNIAWPGFMAYVNIPKGLMIETEVDSLGEWVSKEFSFYDPEDENRSRPMLELNISRDTLPISGDCVFRVYSTAYQEYCSNVIDSSSQIREIAPQAEPDLHYTLSAWPNPASNFLNISIESGLDDENIDVEIINLEGKIVLSGSTLTNHTSLINVSGFPSGLYFLRASTGKGLIVDRILIQH